MKLDDVKNNIDDYFDNIGDEYLFDKLKSLDIKEIKFIRLEKIEELHDAKHKNNIFVGYKKDGFFINEPVVGQRFYVSHYYSTSVVTEILNENTFKTLNSVYKWYFIDKPVYR